MLHFIIHTVIEIHNPHQNAELVDGNIYVKGDNMGHDFQVDFDNKKQSLQELWRNGYGLYRGVPNEKITQQELDFINKTAKNRIKHFKKIITKGQDFNHYNDIKDWSIQSHKIATDQIYPLFYNKKKITNKNI